MADKLILNGAEAQTALWQKIKAHYEKQLDLLRKQNDGELNEIETAKMRGRILEVKAILALDKLPPGTKIGDSLEPPIEY